jgi:enoyl-[acyl-carrier protein] reductase/trans-2-enoyl-CoA reductase (NAD+)
LLIKVMTEKGLEEGPIEQIRRLFADLLATSADPETDDANRLRMDNREMRTDVQTEIAGLWPQVTTENLRSLTDFAGFQRQFRNLFGFDVEGVDYGRAVEIKAELPSER